MKIAIPVEENNLKSKICVSFGRTPYFLIYDTNSNKSDYVENSAANSTGGAGIKAAQIIVDNKVSALLTPRCGQNAAEVMKSADIEIFKTISNSIQENIDLFNGGNLAFLQEIHEGFHGNGGK